MPILHIWPKVTSITPAGDVAEVVMHQDAASKKLRTGKFKLLTEADTVCGSLTILPGTSPVSGWPQGCRGHTNPSSFFHSYRRHREEIHIRQEVFWKVLWRLATLGRESSREVSFDCEAQRSWTTSTTRAWPEGEHISWLLCIPSITVHAIGQQTCFFPKQCFLCKKSPTLLVWCSPDLAPTWLSFGMKREVCVSQINLKKSKTRKIEKTQIRKIEKKIQNQEKQQFKVKTRKKENEKWNLSLTMKTFK